MTHPDISLAMAVEAVTGSPLATHNVRHRHTNVNFSLLPALQDNDKGNATSSYSMVEHS